MSQWPKDELLIVTFDEDGSYNATTHGYNKSPNHVFTAFYGGGVHPGTISKKRYTHYSLLKTIEAALHLKSLGQKDKTAHIINDVWN